ncbi:MAG: DNA repair protein RadC [Thermodesulfovibrionales bacterium]|nr:DNA repair protein RadC [Thermodesulfovibrionales bacterium]
MDKIKEMPKEERPRERLLKRGVEHLSDAQLIAIVLRTGCDSKNALSLAMELLNHFGSLSNIALASVRELRNIKGIGDAKIAQLKASFELGKRLVSETSKKDVVLNDSNDVYRYVFTRFHGVMKEMFYCLMLDVKNRLICETLISIGSLSESLVHPREAFKDAIKVSAASVIFIHNHPSGDPEPSSADIQITQRLKNTAEIIGISLLDHIIIGDNKFVSMKKRGLI